MRTPTDMPQLDLIYLDCDGVLHPGEVWFDRTTKRAQLRAPGHELFESVHLFEEAIAPYASVQVILSSSWVPTFGLEQTRAFLPKTLQPRVIGATYDPQAADAWRFDRLRRYDAIALDAQRRKPARWLAVDDDPLGWPESELGALALTPTSLGLACPLARAQLRDRLADRFR
ncbi:MAG TPA: HAD domain-containing protein [Steroidobacteraceae bacterium]